MLLCRFARFIIAFWLSLPSDHSVLPLVYRLPIRSTGSLRTRLLHSGQWRSVVDRTRNDLAVDTDRHSEFYRGFYTSTIELGTPPQKLLVAFDTGCPYFWVIDHRCRSESCLGASISAHNKTRFNASASTSLHGNGRSFTIPCVYNPYQEGRSHKATRGHVYLDRLQIGPLHFDDQTFLLADYVADQWSNYPLDGVLGLAWPSPTERGQRPALMNLLDQLDQPVFTVWVDWRRPAAMGGSGGFLTLGGPDTDHCSGPWHHVSLGSRSSWQFPIQHFKVGRFRSFRSQFAMADTGTAMIGGPYPQINMIIDALGAEFSQDDDLFTILCNRIPELPPFILTINGTDFAIPPEEYVLDLELPNGKCALGVFGMYSNGFTADWVLGDIFFDTFCTMFDYKQGRLSFARAEDAIPYDVEPFNRTVQLAEQTERKDGK